jgi:molecular chaperone HscB
MAPDFFERLGLPRRFSVDAGELERSYLARSRAIHPDYHAVGSESELTASLELSALVNEAYKTLRDPFACADYLVGLEGGPSASEHKQIPPEFLAEMLEAREQIELARGKPAEIARLEAEFSTRFAKLMEQVAGLFARYEQLPASDVTRANLLPQIRSLLNAAKYVRGLLRDLHAE